MDQEKKLWLDFYDIKVQLAFDSETVLEEIKRDFSYFLSSQHAPDIQIKILYQEPSPDLIPPLKASSYLPAAIVYDDGQKRYVDYKGRAVTVYQYDKEEAVVYSREKDLLHEVSYLLILSRVGELLDRRGVHRIHALGISIEGKAVLCLLPMGGGKTTLALELLKDSRIKLLSDDIPLMTREGNILPFPLRIGVDKAVILNIPSKFLRSFDRRQYGPKTLIDMEYLKDQIASASRPWIVLVGVREFSNRAEVKPLPKIKMFWPFIRDAVIGLGLPQVVEYFLRSGFKDFLKKTGILLSRLDASGTIILKSRTFEFTLGKDQDCNARTLLNFLTEQLGRDGNSQQKKPQPH